MKFFVDFIDSSHLQELSPNLQTLIATANGKYNAMHIIVLPFASKTLVPTER